MRDCDAWSNSWKNKNGWWRPKQQTNARRLDQGIKWDIDSLFLEAKAIAMHDCMLKTKAKKPVDEYKEFDKYMSTGKISNVTLKSYRRSKWLCPFFNWQIWKKNSAWCLTRETSVTMQSMVTDVTSVTMNNLVINEHPKSYHIFNPILKNSSKCLNG